MYHVCVDKFIITRSDANNEARPTGMKMSPITVNIEMTWRAKIK